ncbi:MAG: hypothetical protein AAB448_02450, partial [Patescibacteria group bacterium]
FQSAITELTERMKNEVSFEDARNPVSLCIEQYVDDQLFQKGIFKEESEFDMYIDVALELAEHPEMTNTQLEAKVSLSEAEIVPIRSDSRLPLLITFHALGIRLGDANSLHSLDAAISACEIFIKEHFPREAGRLEFLISQKLSSSAEKNKELIKDLTETLHDYGGEPNEEWCQLMEDTVGVSGKEGRKNKGTLLSFQPKRK